MRLIIIIVLLATFIIQTINMLLLFIQRHSRYGYVHYLFEISLCLQIGIMAFVLTSFHDRVFSAEATLGAHTLMRWLYLLVPLASVAVVIKQRGQRIRRYLILAVLALLLLPCFDDLFKRYSAETFMATAIVLALFSIFQLHVHRRQLDSDTSFLSIKEAFDTLSSGLLFALPNGRIIMQNRCMMSLMQQLLKCDIRNANQLWQNLTAFTTQYEGDDFTCQCDDQTWKLTRTPMSIDNQRYYLIYAANISEQQGLIDQLDAISKQLAKSTQSLTRLIDEYETLQREREALAIKRRIHDIIGQRLSIATMILQSASKERQQLNQAKALLSNIMQDIKIPRREDPSKTLHNLKTTFKFADVELLVSGQIPQDYQSAKALVDIVREATTNAVRHAGATRVNVIIVEVDKRYQIEILDNGQGAPERFCEGGGISGMRAVLAPLAGSLIVQTKPQFKLTIDLPVIAKTKSEV